MKPIQECDQQEKMLRALLVLDGMAGLLPDIMTSEPKTPVEHFVHDVYKISHAAHGRCSGCDTDSKWLNRIEDVAKILKEMKLMNLEKALKRTKEMKP